MFEILKRIETHIESLLASSQAHREATDALAAQQAQAEHALRSLNECQVQAEQALRSLNERQAQVELLLAARPPEPPPVVPAPRLEAFSTHFFRNLLPNDHVAVQKNLMAAWRSERRETLGHADLMDSGFRVFSQNDEDGVLLRLFTHIGYTNRYVIEIGSNCNGSDIGIPENLSTNLIVNHGWHGAVFEMDPVECARMRYFFARDHATRHFHWERDGENTYFSPLITQGAVTPENVNALLLAANTEPEPDLMVIDIDGGDYAVMQQMSAIKPRVIVVEFEKRFRHEHSVYQRDRNDFSRQWQQSGTVSLTAWQKLLEPQGYMLSTVGSCGYNAFFVRADVAQGKLAPADSRAVFAAHPVFSAMPSSFWMTPDDTWSVV